MQLIDVDGYSLFLVYNVVIRRRNVAVIVFVFNNVLQLQSLNNAKYIDIKEHDYSLALMLNCNCIHGTWNRFQV